MTGIKDPSAAFGGEGNGQAASDPQLTGDDENSKGTYDAGQLDAEAENPDLMKIVIADTLSKKVLDTITRGVKDTMAHAKDTAQAAQAASDEAK